MRSATHCTGRCSTSASVGALESNSIARWQRRSSASGPKDGTVSAAELASHFELGREPMAALRYYAEAAESALLHFSPAQTMSLTERALALLPQTVRSDARTALEMTLTALHGTAANQVFGFTSQRRKAGLRARAGAARRRAAAPAARFDPLRAGADAVPERRSGGGDDHRATQRIPVAGDRRPHGADLRLPRARIGRARARAAASRARVAGESHRSRRGAGRGPRRRRYLPQTRPSSPSACSPSSCSNSDSSTRGVPACEPRLRAPLRCASRRRRWPRCGWRRCSSSGWAMPERVADLARTVGATLVEEYALPDGRAVHLWFRGWAEAQLGDPRAGHRLIREGHEEALRLDMRAYAGETLGYATEALVRAGDWLAARQQLDEAMESPTRRAIATVCPSCCCSMPGSQTGSVRRRGGAQSVQAGHRRSARAGSAMAAAHRNGGALRAR